MPQASDVPDDWVVGLQSPQIMDPRCAHVQGVLLERFNPQNVQNGKTRGASDWVAAESAEELHAIGEGSRDFGSRDHSRKREGVADGFPEDNDVRHNALRFESPEMRSQPAARTSL